MLLVGLPHEETGEGMKYEGAWEEGDPGFSEEKLWPATQGPQIRFSIWEITGGRVGLEQLAEGFWRYKL